MLLQCCVMLYVSWRHHCQASKHQQYRCHTLLLAPGALAVDAAPGGDGGAAGALQYIKAARSWPALVVHPGAQLHLLGS